MKQFISSTFWEFTAILTVFALIMASAEIGLHWGSLASGISLGISIPVGFRIWLAALSYGEPKTIPLTDKELADHPEVAAAFYTIHTYLKNRKNTKP